MSGHCKDCRFWDSSADAVNFGWRRKLGLLDEFDDNKLVAALPYPVGVCECPGIPFYQFPAEGGATTVDGSEYRGDLITGPLFGCVLWQSGKREDRMATLREEARKLEEEVRQRNATGTSATGLIERGRRISDEMERIENRP